VYPDERVERFVTREFIASRVHAREQADQFRALGERFGAEWTPTLLVLDADGKEHHRIEGFLPLDDLLAELMLGLGRIDFDAGELVAQLRDESLLFG
jgi:thioredoxin-related protein